MAFRLPCIDSDNEVLTPQLTRRHIHEMFDVDRGEDCLFGATNTPVSTLHAPASAVSNDQSRNRFAREDDTVMRFDEVRKGPVSFSNPLSGGGDCIAVGEMVSRRFTRSSDTELVAATKGKPA